MRILARRRLRPLTHQEALARSAELIEKLKEAWFFLDGEGMDKSGIFTYDANGNLVRPTGREANDQNVQVRPGKQPLSLRVASDGNTRWWGRRFVLNGNSSYDAAPVVVGVKIRQALKAAARE
jgi:hypothetical protein